MVYVGTCGYSYKDWLGSFYPGTVKASEMLRYYARCFGAVEIDTSYYGIPVTSTIERMDANTPAEFRFCFKAPRTVTHPVEPAQARVHGDAALFVRSVAPLLQSRKFGAALLQFPNSFKPTSPNIRYFQCVVEALRPLRLVAEFRNREWQAANVHELLHELDVGWCNVDMPSFESLMRPSSDATSQVGYVRFHGRNARRWWTGDNRTRYDYEYKPEELVPWTDRVADIEQETESTYAFFNNHARGNAPRNAELFVNMLRERFAGMEERLPAAPPRLPVQPLLFEE